MAMQYRLALFNPFTYDEMVKPLQQLTDLLNQYEDAYATTAALAAEVAAKLDSTRDPVAKALYQRYYDDLMNSANQLADRGLTPSSRQALNQFRARYSQEISPILDAITRRSKHQDELRLALLKDPTLLNSGIANIDKYLGNQELSYNAYSGNMLLTQVESAAKHLSKQLRDYGRGKNVDAFTNTFIQQYGIKPSEVDAVIDSLGDPNSPAGKSILGKIVNGVVASSGISQWADDATMELAYQYAGRGAYAALGEDKVSTFTNQGAVLAALEAMATRKAAREAAAKAAKDRAGLVSHWGYAYNPKEFEQGVSNMSKYFLKLADGTYKLNKEGRRFFESSTRSNYNPAIPGYSASASNNISQVFGALGNYSTPEEYEKAYQLFVDTGGLMDAERRSELSYLIDPSDTKNWKRLMNLTGMNDIPEVRYNKETGLYESSGDSISMDDLMSDDWDILDARVGIAGNYLSVKDDDGKLHKIELPSTINISRVEQLNEAIKSLNTTELIYNRMSPELLASNKAVMDNKRAEVTSAIYSILAGFTTTNNAKPNTFGFSSTDFSYHE